MAIYKETRISVLTKEQLKAEIIHWADTMKVKPAQIRIQRMTKKWASCSATGRVSFSYDLLQEPEPFRKYVIIHELLHLQVPNHGRLFKSLMCAYLSGWERSWQSEMAAGIEDFERKGSSGNDCW